MKRIPHREEEVSRQRRYNAGNHSLQPGLEIKNFPENNENATSRAWNPSACGEPGQEKKPRPGWEKPRPGEGPRQGKPSPAELLQDLGQGEGRIAHGAALVRI